MDITSMKQVIINSLNLGTMVRDFYPDSSDDAGKKKKLQLSAVSKWIPEKQSNRGTDVLNYCRPPCGLYRASLVLVQLFAQRLELELRPLWDHWQRSKPSL